MGSLLRSARVLRMLPAFALVGCAKSSGPPPAVAVIVGGEPALQKTIRGEASRVDLGVELRILEPPASTPAPRETAVVEERLALARADYASGELARVRSCADRLAEPELVWSALERGAANLASRVLIWRIACTSITRRDTAVETARTFASLGLELPTDVDAIPVEAHRILTTALQAAETVPKRELSLRASDGARPVAAKITLDGRAACTTDCVVSVVPGDHFVLAERPGYASTAQTIRVSSEQPRTELTLKLPAASPEVAGRQWASTYGLDGRNADSNESVLLLSQALRSRRLVYLHPEKLGDGVRIRGALAVGGGVAARDEEKGPADRASTDVLRELLVRGGVVEDKSLVKKPLFWIGVGAAAIASSLLTAYLLYDPGTRTEVRTR